MSIQYSGNVGIYTYTTGSSTMANDMETALVADLVTAGWTNTPIAAHATATFSGQPSDGDTITLDSSPNTEVYRFKSTMASANDVQIDGSLLATTIGNLVAAITGASGSGTKYFAGTVASPTMTAVATSGTVMTISYKSTASAGNGAAISRSSTAISLSTSTLQGGYNFLKSAITPQNLQCGCKIYTESGSFYNPGAKLQVIAYSADGVLSQTGGNRMMQSTPAATTTWKLVASKYQFMNMAVGTAASTTPGNGFAMGVPYITTNLVAPLIVSASNTTPISCNVPSHGFTTGQTVYIQQGTGMTAINGTWAITVTDINNFTLDTSVGNGTYTGNSASVTNVTLQTSINQAIWACGTDAANPTNFRNSATNCSDFCWQCVNGNGVLASSGIDRPQLVRTGSTALALTSQQQWFDNTFLIAEPFIAWGISGGATPKIIGQLWDAVIIRANVTVDQTAVFDNPSHTFWTVGTDGSANALLFATTA